jgi:hypothetical protein
VRRTSTSEVITAIQSCKKGHPPRKADSLGKAPVIRANPCLMTNLPPEGCNRPSFEARQGFKPTGVSRCCHTGQGGDRPALALEARIVFNTPCRERFGGAGKRARQAPRGMTMLCGREHAFQGVRRGKKWPFRRGSDRSFLTREAHFFAK